MGSGVLGPLRLEDTTAGAALSTQGRIDDGGGAPDAGPNGDGLYGAVAGASSALDAGIAVGDHDRSVILSQNFPRTNRKTHTAADAFILQKLKSGYIF